MENIYDTPAHFALDIIGLLAVDGAIDEFDMLGVFQHKPTGRLFWVSSTGDAWWSPFEEFGFNSPDDNDLHEIVDSTWMALQNAVMDFPAEGAEKHKLLRAALMALAQRGTMVFAGPILEGV